MSTKNSFSAGVLIIGNEILSGRTQDLNLAYIGQKLNKSGILVKEASVIPDDIDAIVEAVLKLHKKYDYVFTTGGIGPTHDDVTAIAIAKAFDCELEYNKEAIKILENRYEDRLNEGRKGMARMPKGAKLIPNPVSQVPGFIIENVYVMAGIPEVMKGMLDCAAKDLMQGEPVHSITIRCRLAEGDIAAGLTDIQNKFPDIDIGSYPFFKIGNFGLRIILRTQDNGQILIAAGLIEQLIRSLGDTPIYEKEESY